MLMVCRYLCSFEIAVLSDCDCRNGNTVCQPNWLGVTKAIGQQDGETLRSHTGNIRPCVRKTTSQSALCGLLATLLPGLLRCHRHSCLARYSGCLYCPLRFLPLKGKVDNITMANIPHRLNLCTPLRNALLDAGYSTVKVVNAVNAELGRLECVKETDKTGIGSVTKKTYKVSVGVSLRYEGAKTPALILDAFNSKLEAALKVAEFDSVSLPEVFVPWLESFAAKDTAKVETPETPETPQVVAQ